MLTKLTFAALAIVSTDASGVRIKQTDCTAFNPQSQEGGSMNEELIGMAEQDCCKNQLCGKYLETKK